MYMLGFSDCLGVIVKRKLVILLFLLLPSTSWSRRTIEECQSELRGAVIVVENMYVRGVISQDEYQGQLAAATVRFLLCAS